MSRQEKSRQNGDPSKLKRDNTKSHHKRMGRYDGSYTPSEKMLKARLMRQFISGYDGPRGASPAYINSEVWCRHPGCGRMNGTHAHGART